MSEGMSRRELVIGGSAAALAAGGYRPSSGREKDPPPASSARSLRTAAPPFELDELSIPQLQDLMSSGQHTSASLTALYLERIAQVDRGGPTINSVIELNPEAVTIARALDTERKARGTRGPLHGIPLLLKDNIDTGDAMKTSAGSLALAGSSAPKDVFLVQRLRAAGAVVLGKTNLSEWANFRSSRSTSGWSGRGGLTRNPYALDRNPCGSSSGSGAAIAANLAAVAVGTETDGSIVCPSSSCGLVGLKPTVGLVSRAGVIPISATQDTAGPMTRSVTDAAILLGAMTGVDPRDAATTASGSRIAADYTAFLAADGLRGARIGVLRQAFGFHQGVDGIMEQALAALRDAGAILVDPAALATYGKFDAAEFEVLLYEFKDGIAKYLATRPDVSHRTLSDVIAFNKANAEKEMPFFGQELFEQAEKKGSLASAGYRKARETCRRLSRTEGIDATMAKHRLDALIAPTGGPAWTTDLVNGDHFIGGSSTPAAVAGYPAITVPAGFEHGLPIGLSFIGLRWQEGTLLKLAYGFEQATKSRRSPEFRVTVP